VEVFYSVTDDIDDISDSLLIDSVGIDTDIEGDYNSVVRKMMIVEGGIGGIVILYQLLTWLKSSLYWLLRKAVRCQYSQPCDFKLKAIEEND